MNKKTPRELELEDVLRSAHAIAHREGVDTNWKRFAQRIERLGIGHVTAKTFRILDCDKNETQNQTTQTDAN